MMGREMDFTPTRTLLQVPQRVAQRIARWRYRPAIEVGARPQLVRLGSDYGGWKLEPSADLQHATIISCGLGEDASFDVEFAQRFAARVILVDPTPRAVEHYRQMAQRFGCRAERRYVKGGRQQIDCYELRGLDAHRLTLEPSAIWNRTERLRFFCPAKASDVSHSIVNIQHGYSVSTPYIEVEAVTLDRLLSKYGLHDVPLIKLDVEGAEIEVIQSILGLGLRPRQLLIEFDEINTPGPRSKQRIEAADDALHDAGYVCRYNERANFLYLRA
jgi:FkbM family methyltransferase